jgi:GntR family transcriptional regulator
MNLQKRGTYNAAMSPPPIDRQSRRPLVEQVADVFRQRIDSGELPPGSRLPAEQEIAEQYGLARDTVRRALNMLTQEGLLRVARGKGRLVRDHSRVPWWPQRFESASTRKDTPGTGLDAWAADIAQQGSAPRQEVEVKIVEAPALVAERLGLEPGTSVVTRRRIRYVNDLPNQIADSYYPMDVAIGSPIMTPGDITIPGGLMTAAGHPQVRFVDEIVGRLADAEERQRLNLPPVTAVAEHVRTGFNKDDRPVRVIVTIGERMTIMYESDGQ